MISHKYKIIFVHVPRTGGTSVEKLFWPSKKDKTEKNLWMGYVRPYYNKYQTGGMQHLLASQIYRELGEEVFREYFKFTFVRNPWDKIVSQFFYIKKRKDLMDFIGLEKEDDFHKYLLLIKKRKHVQWEEQYKFILDENGESLVDYIGRFETLEKLLKRLNLSRTFFGLKNGKSGI